MLSSNPCGKCAALFVGRGPTQCPLTGQETDDESERIWTVTAVACQDSRCPGRDSNRVLPEPERYSCVSVWILWCGLLRWQDRNIEPLTAVSIRGSDVTKLFSFM
jgi:hypothetical protein